VATAISGPDSGGCFLSDVTKDKVLAKKHMNVNQLQNSMMRRFTILIQTQCFI
jgi:hypothetical protein